MGDSLKLQPITADQYERLVAGATRLSELGREAVVEFAGTDSAVVVTVG